MWTTDILAFLLRLFSKLWHREIELKWQTYEEIKVGVQGCQSEWDLRSKTEGTVEKDPIHISTYKFPSRADLSPANAQVKTPSNNQKKWQRKSRYEANELCGAEETQTGV